MFAILASLVMPSVGQSQRLVDQQQLLVQGGFPLGQKFSAQSFTTLAPNVSGAGFLIRNVFGDPRLASESSELVVSLWDALPSTVGATRLAIGSTVVSGQYYGVDVWADVFWNPAAVMEGKAYWLTVGSRNPIFQLNVHYGNPYLQGNSAHTVHDIASPVESDPYEQQDSQDLVFRTYTTVPEPDSALLSATGLALVALVHRLRRKRQKPSQT
jgi:hypothetical protein